MRWYSSLLSFAGLVARPAILSFTSEVTFAEDNTA